MTEYMVTVGKTIFQVDNRKLMFEILELDRSGGSCTMGSIRLRLRRIRGETAQSACQETCAT